jgi:hypothetical protein
MPGAESVGRILFEVRKKKGIERAS